MEKVDKEHIEKMRILQIIRKNALNMNWKCMVDGCPEKTINSHLLQRHGVSLLKLLIFHSFQYMLLPLLALKQIKIR